MERFERMVIINNDKKTGKKSIWTIFSCFKNGEFFKCQLEVDGRIVMEDISLNGLLGELVCWDIDNLPGINDEKYFFRKIED